ncbi:MAG: filamentous hemagglutinin N-terminal domain-containing protein, partial [Nitrospina sp.]|nr:filamentous hemagglutinin N-terminal domain-containing protein [Nitrospina sp.]
MFSNSYKCVSRKIIALILIYLIGAFPVLVYALPQDGKIVSGSGTIKSDGAGKLTVNQTSQKIAINWKNFSIGKNESVVFLQPNISSSALNNINGSLASIIQGRLSANGQIILVNTNGIQITSAANIDV